MPLEKKSIPTITAEQGYGACTTEQDNAGLSNAPY